MNLSRRVGSCLALLCLVYLVIGASFPPNMPQLCYTSKDQLAPSNLMPCFDSTVGDRNVYGCCLSGDYCLSNQACYNIYHGITYQKGCTKKYYDHPSCPLKCETNQTKSDYISLIYCNGTNGTPKNTWICHNPDNCLPSSNCKDGTVWSPGLEATRRTFCQDIRHDKEWVAFYGPELLKSTASLPTGTEVISWYSAHSNYSTRWVNTGPETPQFTAPFATKESSDASQLTASIRATETLLYTIGTSTLGDNRPTSTSNSTTDLPKEAPSSHGPNTKLAVGMGMGIPVVLAALGILGYFLRKRRAKADVGEQLNPASMGNQGDGTHTGEQSTGATGEAYGYSVKAELSAEEKPARISEMEGSNVHSTGISKHSDKKDVREHGGVDDSVVYELPG